MSNRVIVRITPTENRVRVGSTAVFACDTPKLRRGGDTVEGNYWWEAAVQIANETRYSFENDRRKVLHITNVQAVDNNTDVACNVRTSRGKYGKATAKIFVDEIANRDVYKIPPLTTARQEVPITGVYFDKSTPPVSDKNIGHQSLLPAYDLRLANGIALGAVLGGLTLLVLVLLTLVLFASRFVRRVVQAPFKVGTLDANRKQRPASWCDVADKGDDRATQYASTYAKLGECRANIYEDLKIPALISVNVCGSYIPRNDLGGGSSYGSYENVAKSLRSLPYPPMDVWNPKDNLAGSSLPCLTMCGSHDNRNRNPTTPTTSCPSSLHADSSSRHDCCSRSYENVAEVLATPDYENCNRRRQAESVSSDVTYADLDFGDGPVPAVAETEVLGGDNDSVEYSKVLQVLSVYRNSSGSTTVKVIETDKFT